MSIVADLGHQEVLSFLSNDDAALVLNAILNHNQQSSAVTAPSVVNSWDLDFDLFAPPALEGGNIIQPPVGAYLESPALTDHDWLEDCLDDSSHISYNTADFMPAHAAYTSETKKDISTVDNLTTYYPSPQESIQTDFVLSPSEAPSPLFNCASPAPSTRDVDPLFAPLEEIHAPHSPPILPTRHIFLPVSHQLTDDNTTEGHISVPISDFTSLLSKLVRPIPLAEAPTPPVRAAGRRRPSKVYLCPAPDCPKSFTRRYNLQTHLRTHDTNRERPFLCDDCDKTFVRVHDLDRHRSVHAKEKVHKCSGEGCGKRFTRRDALRRHMKTSGCAEVAEE